MSALEQLVSKQALSELVAAYSRAADRCDEDALAALFHPGSEIDSGVIRAEARQFAHEFVAWVREHSAGLSHAVCSSWFELRGDAAVGETYVVALCRFVEKHGGGQALTFGRYLDRFERRDGRWKFSERRFVVDGDGRLPVDASSSSRSNRFKPHDPIYALWSQLQNPASPDLASRDVSCP